MKIGIDLDGVMFDFLGNFLEYARVTTGVALKPHEIIRHDFTVGDTPEETSHILWSAMGDFQDAGGYEFLEPLPGAVDAIKSLRAAGHELFFITFRSQFCFRETLRSFARVGLEIPDLDHLFFGKNKMDVVEEFGIHIHIDDYPDVAEGMANRFGRAILFDAPFNQHVEDVRINRVKDWTEVLSVLSSVESSIADDKDLETR